MKSKTLSSSNLSL